LVAVLVVTSGASSVKAAPTTSSAGWTVYHGSVRGSGVASAVKSVNTARAKWTSRTLDGQLYGEPLVWSGHVYVATENDTVYALSGATGAVLWARHVGTPVAASALPCGNIAPNVGVTGTPVIDAARHELFVVAEELISGRPHHLLVGLDATTGIVRQARSVDPAGSDRAALLQRTGLTLDAGRVVFGLGGLYGDCGHYHGTVVALRESGGRASFFTVDHGAGQSQGAIWMGGAAPVIDAESHVWVSVGNGSVQDPTAPYDHSDSVLELNPSMQLVQYFAPTTWAQDNAADLDLSMAPVLLPSGQVVVAGKAGVVYLLDGNHLGGIGDGQASLAGACTQDIDGASANLAMTVYLPCRGGIVAVRVSASPPALHLLWTATSGAGPPIVAANLVWSIGPDGVLYGLDPATGAVRRRVAVGVAANHFPTPGLGDGLLLVPTSNRVVAFATSFS
jgi:outer membrane protein assembly factor BamB